MAPLIVSAGLTDVTGDTPLLAVPLGADATHINVTLAPLDAALGGALARTFAARDFRGNRDETLFLAGGTSGPRRVLLVGLGKSPDRPQALRRAAALAARRAHGLGVGTMSFYAGPSATASLIARLPFYAREFEVKDGPHGAAAKGGALCASLTSNSHA